MTAVEFADAQPLIGAATPKGSEKSRSKRAKNLFGLKDEVFEKPIVTGQALFGRYAVVSDPAGIRRVLVENAANYPKTDFDTRFFAALFGGGLLGSQGEVWRRHRRVMAPAFDPRSVAAYGPAITATVGAFLEGWAGKPAGAAIDMAEEMKALTLQVIARTVFSTDSEEVIGLVGGALTRGLREAATANLLDLIPVVKDWRMSTRERRLAEASRDLDRAVADLVRHREANLAGAPADLLTRLVAAKDDEGGGGLSAKEIRDEIVTIFMAGHETTANTLSWIWYVLAQRPAAKRALEAELDAVLGGRLPAQEDLPNLLYTRRVVEEAMRLYPAAPGLSARQAQEADEVCGRPIPKGTRITILPWVLHRHRTLWDNADEFDPDRFAPERAAGRHRFSYLPFGAGPRVCIGQVLAMNETILILAALAQAYRPRLAPDADVVPQANVTLFMKHGLKMILERRAPAI
jgi:cytochrome P450